MLRIAKSLITIVAVLAIAAGATGAWFTSTVPIDDNEISTGTLTLALDPNTPGNGTPITLQNLQPGDGTANELHHRWNLINDGSLNLKYRIRAINTTAAGNDDLYNQLRFKLGEYSSGPNKDLGTNLTLADLEAGILIDSNVIPTALDTRVRTVFVRPYLPTTAGDEVQGETVTFDIIFEATQTNNPGW
jgi:predicted ribosomally synthesized peptide with SipW-like signal peptide